MKYAIDRFEGNIAVCENILNGEKLEIDKTYLPNDAKEGSIIIKENNAFKLDLTEEEIRRKRIEEKLSRLKKENK